MTDLLTTKQVQDLLRVDRTTIYRMVEGGQLPALRVGKQWRFARAEVERWLHAARSGHNGAPAAEPPVGPVENRGGQDLRTLLPLDCVQLIQDAFAEALGVMLVVTDMQGRQVTDVSNACGFFTSLIADNPAAVNQCVATWQQLAGAPALEPRFSLSEMGLLCARGLIRGGTELKGMVVVGGIAPEGWPPSAEHAAALAHVFQADPAVVAATVGAVYQLDRTAQERALRYVQRIADIFSHILEDRGQMLGRLEAAAALAPLQ